MEIRSQEEVFEQIKNFAKELNKLQLAKKSIDEEIKELKQAYKEEGVAVGVVVKALNALKKELKETDSEKMELELIIDLLGKDVNIVDDLTAMVAK